jgi:ribose transport system ATP-binding protein
MVVRENLYINPVATGKRVMEPVWRRGEQASSAAVLKRFSVRPQDPERVVATLSGGNQQKVVVARWMEAKVRLLVLEEPTIGVDVGSKAEIYHLLQQSLKEGLAVLLLSSDFEEVERICHRALVFSRGRVVSEIPRHELTIARLTADASGGSLSEPGGSQA